MDPEEFEQLQAALVASMNQDNEEIIIGEDDEEDNVTSLSFKVTTEEA